MTIELAETDGTLTENVVHFCRALRKANVKVSTAQLETAIQAIEVAGFGNRTDFYYTLQCTLIANEHNREIFRQLFLMFWRDPEFLKGMVLQHTPPAADELDPTPPAQRRAAEALANLPGITDRQAYKQKDATMTMSEQEVLRSKDFEQMSTEELKEAQQIIKTLELTPPTLASRRTKSDHLGQLSDPAATLRKAMRQMGDIQQLERKSLRIKKPGLVVICDISGSMSVYSRMFMQFTHALAHNRLQQWSNVSVFTFGTRLTNVTSAVRHRDADIALSKIGAEATDWEGGTMIGATIREFNKTWARRLLGRGAVVLLISDGLERGDTSLLSEEMARLHLLGQQLVWLNPLLRWDGFSPKASGIKAMLPHVDRFHACHSLASLADLALALSNNTSIQNYEAMSNTARYR